MQKAIAFVDSGTFPGIVEYFDYSYMWRISTGSTVLSITEAVPDEEFCIMSAVVSIDCELATGHAAILYCHGTDSKLYVPTTPSSSTMLDVSNAALLANHLVAFEQGESHTYNCRYLGLSTLFSNEFFPALLRIRKQKIPYLVLMACNVGKNTQLMAQIGRVFGAQNVVAPNVRTGFVATEKFAVTNKHADFEQAFRKIKHGVGGWHKYGTEPGRRIFFRVTIPNKHKPKFNLGEFFAESDAAISDFLTKVCGYPIMSEVSQVCVSKLYLHGITENNTTIIFPGEQAYGKHWITVKPPADPPPKIGHKPVEASPPTNTPAKPAEKHRRRLFGKD